MKNSSQTVYLDYAAATPVRPGVIAAMEPYWQQEFANPQSVHQPGREAAAAIKDARHQIAETLSVQTGELVFTSGATEANSLALLGVTRAATAVNDTKPEVFLSEIAHGSVVNIAESHDTEVFVQTVAVDVDGRLDPAAVYQKLTPETVVVSCSHANSEIGTIQPTRELAAVIAKWRREQGTIYPLLHVDASQTALHEDISPESLGADLLTVNSSKTYGPKGIGLLWVRSGTPMSPLMIAPSDRQVGDYQKLRAGTPPTPLIIGFAAALTWAQKNYEEHAEYVRELQWYLIDQIKATFPEARFNGSRNFRSPHNVNLTLPDTDHDFLATQLAEKGIAVATTSACQASSASGSHVLQKLGGNQALRISIGLETTRSQLDRLMMVLKTLL